MSLRSWFILGILISIILPTTTSFAAPLPNYLGLLNQAPSSGSTSSASHHTLLVDAIQEIWKKSQSLRPKPSMETTPVTAKVGDVLYSIPRNYISSFFDFPVLKVTYPGFKPLTEETRGCFDAKLRDSLGCTTLELNLRLSLPNKPRFENSIKAAPPFHARLSPRPGPGGYDIYDLGPDDARIEIYRSESEDIFFNCKIFDNNGVRDAVCDDAVSLPDGNAVRFFFGLKQIPELRSFEAGIRQLMSNFEQGDKK